MEISVGGYSFPCFSFFAFREDFSTLCSCRMAQVYGQVPVVVFCVEA